MATKKSNPKQPNKKMWSGAFVGTLNPQADDFNSSLRFDKRMYQEDITGSIAHCEMLGKQKILPLADVKKITDELKNILSDIEKNKIKVQNGEDIHMFVEQVLTDRIGDVGKKLHTGRSRNDQVALDTRMYIKRAINEVRELLKNLINELVKIAKENLETIMPAFTHLQKAQPTTLAHYLMAYAEMFTRDLERFVENYKRTDYMPLGNGALCGTTYNIDREYTKKYLGFANLTPNSLDGVSDRDYLLEFLFNSSTTMMHLSRFNEEIIIFVSNDYRYAKLSDQFSTGSSIMPQKKNPDINELVRGKTGRVYGDLISLLTTMKGLPLAYNKDMQEDKECIFDCYDTIKICLEVFTLMLPTLVWDKERMLQSANGGHMAATDVADYLVGKNVPFRDAHEISGSLVRYCLENNKTLNELKLEEYKKFSKLFEKDIYKKIDLKTLVENRKVPGGPSKAAVKKEIADLLAKLKSVK